MVRKSFSIVALFLISSVFICPVSAQNSASVANRRTAVRYLQLAKQFASEKLWNEAESNAKMGLAYDDSIADLWYIRSVAKHSLGEKKSQILPLIVTALTEAEWVDYNKDGARVLYADLLCTTRQFTQALAVLDAEPFIYSADAEFIRAKAYYNIGDEGSTSKARSRIDAARRVYPADERFAKIFYAYEYQLFRKTGALSQDTQKLADAFALMLPLYKNASEDLEIYAAIFATDDAKKTRMLKAFQAKNYTSPLYALEALKTGLLDEDAALDYFYQFSDAVIDFSLIEEFARLLTSDEAKNEFAQYLTSYNGTLTIDTDSDLIPNMKVVYKRGRPESIAYDENQDDDNEWSAFCDFGVPVTLVLAENALELTYGNWPFIQNAVYKMDNAPSDLRFTLIAEALAWTPFSVEPSPAIKDALNSDFFVPLLLDDGKINSVTGNQLLRAALSYTIPSKERDGAVIQVSLLNGVAQIASYSVGEKIYAIAQFEKGIPVSRKLDVDGDGLFETSETYGFSTDSSQNFISTTDEMQIMTNLFGAPAYGTGFYVKKITVDRNGDTIPDFTEEYLPGTVGDKKPGKISSWDTDSDGSWDVQYIKYPSMIDGKLREEAKFHQPLTHSLVTVSSENGIPVFVQNGQDILSVAKGKSANFYWISDAGSQKDEENISSALNQVSEQGVSMIVESGTNRFLAVRIEQLIFGMNIPQSERKK